MNFSLNSLLPRDNYRHGKFFSPSQVAAFVSVCLSLAALPGSAFADLSEIRVLGCDGSPRAMRTVPSGSVSTVEIRVLQGDSGASQVAASQVPYELRGGNGNRLVANVVSGRGVFNQATAGEWTLCPVGLDSDGAYTVSQVAIINREEEEVSKTAWLSMGGVVLTGAGFGVLSGAGGSGEAVPSSSGQDGSVPAPSTGNPLPQPLMPSDSAGSVADADDSPSKVPGRPNCAAEEDCLKGERPPPISPIS